MAEDPEVEASPPKKRRSRLVVDWPLTIMLLGAFVFLLVFGAITCFAPRRPFLALRGAGGPRPAATAPAPANTPATAPGAVAAATATPAPGKPPAKP